VSGGDAVVATKNTRRRVHQKRTRNKVSSDNKSTPIVSIKPVLESTNPFFIAVCAPDSYKPLNVTNVLSYAGVCAGGGGSGGGGSGSGGGRRDIAVVHRQKPNVFLRQNSNSNIRNPPPVSNVITGSGMTNHFIHHPVIQNDRQRGETTSVSASVSASASAPVSDKEQFPSLSNTVSSVAPATKLNFKEMVLKSAGPIQPQSSNCAGAVTAGAGAAGAGTGAVAGTVDFAIPKVRTEYSRSALSSGNIFLGAFYGSRNNDDACGDDGYGDNGRCGSGGDDGGGGGGGGGGGSFISSSLIDSCDRKYDNLYR
jgi:hypothetical protein